MCFNKYENINDDMLMDLCNTNIVLETDLDNDICRADGEYEVEMGDNKTADENLEIDIQFNCNLWK